MNYLMIGCWLKTHGFSAAKRVRRRIDVYRNVRSNVSEPILYLEFGVYNGQSMREWSALLDHPDSRLIGFDSFEGLPEDFDFTHKMLKGKLNMKGRIPEIEDTRITFIKGWFEETLPSFTAPRHTQLVVNIDCDLYSATKAVLGSLANLIKPGTILIFDDMSQIPHEPTAFSEFLRDTGKSFSLTVASFEDVFAFKCIE